MCSIANEDEFAFMSRGNRCSEEEGPLFDFFRFSVVQICKSNPTHTTTVMGDKDVLQHCDHRRVEV